MFEGSLPNTKAIEVNFVPRRSDGSQAQVDTADQVPRVESTDGTVIESFYNPANPLQVLAFNNSGFVGVSNVKLVFDADMDPGETRTVEVPGILTFTDEEAQSADATAGNVVDKPAP